MRITVSESDSDSIASKSSSQESILAETDTIITRNDRRRWLRLPPKFFRWLGGVLVVGVIIAVAILYIPHPIQSIDRSGYQVVYLVNGQAYFGKLQNTTGEYLVMRTPYVAQSVETPGADGQEAAPTTTLLRVRDQTYGPEDSIAFKAEQVSFWQNLRSDSKVTAAIKQK